MMLENLDGNNDHFSKTNIKELLDIFLKNLNIDIDESKKEKILKYAYLVIEYNKNVNITGAKDEETFLKSHIADSLLAFKFFENSKNVLDVGSGSGLPSIPLSILYEDINFTLCESKNKKALFLETIKNELNIKNIKVKCINVYEIKEKYDVITARAFSDLKTLLKIFLKLKTSGGKLIAYKGKKEKIDEEISSLMLPSQYSIEITHLNTNFLDSERHIVLIK